MRPLKRKNRQTSHPPRGGQATSKPAPAQPIAGRQRVWLFRLAAMLAIPFLFLGALELGLRWTGFGYPATFFLKSQRDGRQVYVENGKFGFRYFPPGMARSPAPIIMPAEKEDGTIRIFIFGESAALGDPKPAYGFGRYLQVLLDERHPELGFEVICVAMTAINSHAILEIARECRKRQGDFWVVYMGNNELTGPFGATGVLGKKTPGLLVTRLSLALKKTRLGQLIESGARRLAGGGQAQQWTGLQLWEGRQIPPDDPGRAKVETRFRRNLNDILAAGAKAGVQTILCTVASNLENCGPYASMHSSAPAENRKELFQALYQTGMQAEAAGEPGRALEAYRQAGEIDPQHAELQFRMARRHQALSEAGQALRHYELARDYDALPFRTTTPLNQIIRGAAEAFQDRGVKLVDVAALMAEESPSQIPGLDLFVDHVHYSFEGNYLLALAVARELDRMLPVTEQRRDGWLSGIECELRLALTSWNRYIALEGILGRLAGAPYTNQLDNLETRRRHARSLSELREHMREGDPNRQRSIYLEALAQAPDDFFLRQNFAEYLELSGRLEEAIGQWREVSRLIPHHPAAYFHSGRLLIQRKQFAEGAEAVSQALAIRPDFPEGMIELGKALAGRGRHEAALTRYAQALRMAPENASTHLLMAESLAAQDRLDEALEHLREAVRLWPGYWEARYLLGVALALRNQLEEAVEQFEEVTRLRPGHVMAHFNLGVGLARLGRTEEAAVVFHQTLQLDPANEAAREYLQTLSPAGQPSP